MKKNYILLLFLIASYTLSAQLVLNEVLYDPDPVLGDANRDGTIDFFDDEFAEFVNIGAAPLDISGYKIYDANRYSLLPGSDNPRHIVPANTIIPAGGIYVVFGGIVNGLDSNFNTIRAAFPDVIFHKASGGALDLQNASDMLYVTDASCTLIITFNPDTLSLDMGINQSAARKTGNDGNFVRHFGIDRTLFSPGALTYFTDTFPLILNETLFDGNGDANGDGVDSFLEDEFIEFYNNTGASVDISGYKIFDHGNMTSSSPTPRHIIPANTVIADGEFYVVFGGGGVPGSVSGNTFGNSVVHVSSSNLLQLSNTDEIIYVLDPSDNLVLSLDYAEIGLDMGANQSATRFPDVTGSFVLHNDARKGLNFSPGTGTNPNAVDPPLDATLSNIAVDGVDMEFFYDEILSYKFYLPYTYNTIPVITSTTTRTIASQIITQATNINGTEAERTATVEVTSQDNSSTITYSVIFEQLPELDLFLGIGQSNMSGRAPMDESLGDLIPVENAYLLASTTEVIDAVNPFNLYSNIRSDASIQRVSPTFSFSKIVTENINNKIGFVVNSLGGSDMTSWDEKTDELYSKTMIRAKEAQKWGTFKAVLWHQGESNASSSEVAAYPNQLINLVENLRDDLGDPNLFFVAGQIGQWKSVNDDFNAMITTISTFVNNSACVLSDELINRDDAHFDRAGQIILGERYGGAVLNHVYDITLDTNKFDISNNTFITHYDKKIHIDTNTSYDVFIYDITGKKIYSEKDRKENIIDLKHYQNGIYIVKIKSNEKMISKKIFLHK